YPLLLLHVSSYDDHRDLHSFPTRRSSDLEISGDPTTGPSFAEHLVDTDGDGVKSAQLGPQRIQVPVVGVTLRRVLVDELVQHVLDRKSTRLNSSHVKISYAVFCLKKKRKQ